MGLLQLIGIDFDDGDIKNLRQAKGPRSAKDIMDASGMDDLAFLALMANEMIIMAAAIADDLCGALAIDYAVARGQALIAAARR